MTNWTDIIFGQPVRNYEHIQKQERTNKVFYMCVCVCVCVSMMLWVCDLLFSTRRCFRGKNTLNLLTVKLQWIRVNKHFKFGKSKDS